MSRARCKGVRFDAIRGRAWKMSAKNRMDWGARAQRIAWVGAPARKDTAAEWDGGTRLNAGRHQIHADSNNPLRSGRLFSKLSFHG